MENVQTMAGGHAGYVRAIFSARCRGFAAPVDLLRVQLRAANRLSAEHHNAAVYARLADDFSGYLVTDNEFDSDSFSDADGFEAIDLIMDDGEQTTAETAERRARMALGFDDFPSPVVKIWRDDAGRVMVLGGAVNHANGVMKEFAFEPDGTYLRSMDAQTFMPAGCLEKGMHGGEVMADVKLFARAGCFE